MKKFSTISLLFCILFCGITAHAQTTEIQGQQTEEKLIRWLWIHRISILDSCLSDAKVCGANDSLKPQIAKIRDATVLSPTNQLQFLSEKTNPDIFQSVQNETHRIAVTGNSPTSQIVFNRDRIVNASLVNLSGILFHEFAHHIGLIDDQNRVPDQIGARIAQHLQSQLMTAQLQELNFQNVEVGIFQFAYKQTYLPNDVSLKLWNFAYVTDGVRVLDVNLGDFKAVAACDKSSDALYVQKSDAPAFTVTDKHSVRLVSSLKNFCGPKVLAPKSDMTISNRSFSMTFDVTKQGEILTSTLTTYLNEGSADEVFDKIKTLKLKDLQLSSTSVAQGASLELTMSVEALKPTSPDTCEIGFTNPAWPKQKDNIPTFAVFDQCSVQPMGSSVFQIKATLHVPKGLATGEYQLSILNLKKKDGSADPAILMLPPKSKFTVTGQAPGDVIKILSVTFPGLKPLASLGDYKLTNSAIYRLDTGFDVVVEVESQSAIIREGLSLGLAVQQGDGLSQTHFMAQIEDLKFLIPTHDAKKTTKGYLLTYHVKLPRQVQALNVFGLIVEGLIYQNESMNWSGITFPQFDHMIMMDKLVEASP